MGAVERMLKALIKSLENKPLNPWILESFLPTNWEKIHKFLLDTPDVRIYYFLIKI